MRCDLVLKKQRRIGNAIMRFMVRHPLLRGLIECDRSVAEVEGPTVIHSFPITDSDRVCFDVSSKTTLKKMLSSLVENFDYFKDCVFLPGPDHSPYTQYNFHDTNFKFSIVSGFAFMRTELSHFFYLYCVNKKNIQAQP